MEKNLDSNQVVIDTAMFMAIYRSNNIDPRTMKHIRKFNPELRAVLDSERKAYRAEYRKLRDMVLDLNDRHGKIVFVESKDAQTQAQSYEPMLLIGKDHKNKHRLMLRRLYYMGSKGLDIRAKISTHILHIKRIIPEDYVYWQSGHFLNKFTEIHPRRDSYLTLFEYLSQWRETLR